MEHTTQVAKQIGNSIHAQTFVKLVASNPFLKTETYAKVVLLKKTSPKGDFYQWEQFYGQKVQHENTTNINEVCQKVEALFATYRQMNVQTSTELFQILINKNGTCKVLHQKTPQKKEFATSSEHNNQKQYLIQEGKPVGFLVALGVMNQQGVVLSHKQKKFRQINRFLEMVDDVAQHLPNEPYIVDVGCGKAYLTFALYHYFHEIKGKQATILGLDIKADVVENCQALAKELNYTKLFFQNQNIENWQPNQKNIDMLVCLHACDTATDYALKFAVVGKAKVVLAAPCCQHELMNQVENEMHKPLFKHGILKERMAALLTDGLRALLLESLGYKTTVMEFVDSEHTAKNILIRAVLQKGNNQNKKAQEEFCQLAEFYQVFPKLYALLKATSIYSKK